MTLKEAISRIRDRSIVAPEDVADAFEEIDQRLRAIEQRFGPTDTDEEKQRARDRAAAEEISRQRYFADRERWR